ncbi:MFS transporter [Candidatus Hydrogenosomobacter endosymbioticus]|uniref:MFS transporter n=1 Tax=Candidatus Hydrogenosomobacter endosymbioticus TaxID=2558174 RepID=A0ABN6L2U7_9PROT|nr:MFS transporter [Candidatus Hydrogenosomobacter endosymbioticus]BDB96202.1 MFS transporter [Candidatus Hydrogenosomobacter endosymbioticus]
MAASAKPTCSGGCSNSESKIRSVVSSCMIGNALEWYDFILFGYFATIIAQQFFPSSDNVTALLKSYGIFVAGFVMRPLGAFVFGYIGDRIGRKKALMWSIYFMAVPTTIMGLLPSYDQIGWSAALLLILLRLFQGLSMGGEFTGSMVFIVENSPDKSRGFWGSCACLSVVIGLIVGSSLASFISSVTTHEQLILWGWRIPFVISIFGSMVGAYMRTYLDDPKAFSDSRKNESEKKEFLFKELFRDHWKSVITIILIDFTISVGFFLITVFVMSYLQTFVGFSYLEASIINSVSMLVFAAMIPLSGLAIDKIGRRPVLLFASGLFFALSYPLFKGLSSGSWNIALISQIIFAVLLGINYAPIPSVLSEQFPTKVRFSGISIAHNLSMTIFGGTAPEIVTWLLKSYPDFLEIPGLYLMFAGAMAFLGALLMKDRTGQPL